MARICPNCSATMVVENVHGVDLDVCPNCAGIWLNADELRMLLQRDPEALEELATTVLPQATDQKLLGPSTFQCPDDGSRLEEYHYLYNSPVLLRTCPKCGGFSVAHDELPAMQEWRMKLHQPTRAEDVGMLLAEATVAHQQEMARQHSLFNFFTALRHYQPGWYGIWP